VTIFEKLEAGGSVLFDPSKDSLAEMDGLADIQEIQTRVVDLLILTGLGLDVDIEEFQVYAKQLVGMYANLGMTAKLKASTIKNEELRVLEQEWLAGNEMIIVQLFFKGANASIVNAAKFCGVEITELPTF
jgi:hypothetical protein